MANRKLIRPDADLVKEPAGRSSRRKQAPPEQTSAEEFYYVKQMAAKTPMVLVLTDGQEVRGWIEWYDKNCLKVNRDRGPNLLIQKASIKYLYKQTEEEGQRGGGNR
jgi:sRNA-binding regulator protein Hfq